MARVYENGVMKMTMADWKKTHRDFKGIIDKQRTVTHFIAGKGTCLVWVEIVKE